MSSAKNPVPRRKKRSSALLGENRGLGMSYPAITSELDLLECDGFQSDDFFRQRSVAELRSESLSVRQRPLHEIDHDPGPLLVLRALEEEQPREGGDRVNAAARSVRDR